MKSGRANIKIWKPWIKGSPFYRAIGLALLFTIHGTAAGNERLSECGSGCFRPAAGAAHNGSGATENRMETIYLSGFGVAPDSNEAFHWFQASANAGPPGAPSNLATMRLAGTGTGEKPAQKAQWLEKAARQNHAEAELLLAHLLEKGQGGTKDPADALPWYPLAANQGQGDAGRAKERLLATMTATDIKKAAAGIKPFMVQRQNNPESSPPGIPLASPSLETKSDSAVRPSSHGDMNAGPPPSGQRVTRGVSGNQPVELVAAANNDIKSKPNPQLPASLEQWEKQIDAGKERKKTAETDVKSTHVSLLTAPTPKTVTTKARQEAEDELKRALAAVENKTPDIALQHLTRAYGLDPLNPEVAKRLGVMTLAVGKPEEALPFFRAATQAAVLQGNIEEAGFATDRIHEIVSIPPPWVEKRLNAAAAETPSKGEVNAAWSNLMETALNRAQAGEMAQALELGQQALSLAKEKLGAGHVSTMLTLREVGNLNLQAGKLDVAETLLQQSVDLGQKLLGDDHPETLAAQTLLAELKEGGMQLDAAIASYQAISSHYAKSFGPDNPRRLQTEIALARVYKNRGDNDESEKILRSACLGMEKIFGFYHPETAGCLQQYAEVLRAQGRFAASLTEMNQALAILTGVVPKQDARMVSTTIALAVVNRDLGHLLEAKRMILGVLDDIKNHPDSLSFLNGDARTHLARVYLDLGELEQAQSLTAALYEEQKAKSGDHHPDTLASMADLAGIKEKKGLYDEAEKGLHAALEGYKKIFGEKHPATITVLNNLGQLMEAAGLYDEAEPILRQAVALSEQTFGKSHPTTLTTLNNLALLYESQGNFDKAEPIYLQAIDAYTQALGPRHADTVAVVNNLAYLYLIKQEYAKSLPLFQRILSVWEDSLGEMHQRTLKALNNLARTYHRLGDYIQAEPLFNQALTRRTKAMGPRHMDTLRTMHDLASLYLDMGRKKEAEELLKKTLSLDDQVLGKLHPYTMETVNTLARTLESKPDLEGAFQVRQEGFSRRTEFLNRMLWSAGDNAREGYIRLHRPELDGYLAMLTRLDAATAGREVLNIALKRKGILLKITSEIQQISRMTQDPQLESISKDLTETRKELASMTLSGPAPDGVDPHFQHLQELEKKVNALQMKLGQASKRFRRSISEVAVNQLIDHLPDDAVLVDFLSYREGDKDKMVAGLLIKNKGLAQFKLVVYPELEPIQKAVLHYRSVIQDDEAKRENIVAAGQEIHRLIWQPIADLTETHRQVYLVPDGILNILPFPALVDNQGRYLTQTIDLHLLGSSRDLIPSDVPAATGQFLILAGPDYNLDKIVADNSALSETLRTRSAALKAGLRAFFLRHAWFTFRSVARGRKRRPIDRRSLPNEEKTESDLRQERRPGEGIFRTDPTPGNSTHCHPWIFPQT
ncbi:MAG: tetratricopeptide repeat protein [Magnetococcales bacterium]|nr:tetratricopeptide repeat protein [Magnetococcales bacterium]